MKHKFRFIIGLLLFLAGMLNYLDRAALSVAAPLVKKDLGIGDAEMGLLFSSFFLGYCIFCFVGGWAADRFGPRKTFAWAAGFWTLFCGLTAAMTSYVQLMVCRILFGVGEGPMGSTTNKTIANWFPREETGTAIGLTNAGQPLGAALAAPVVGLVAFHYGWRVSFVVIAALGLLWLAAWWWLARDTPAEQPKVSAQERQLIESSRARQVPLVEDDGRSLRHYILAKPVLAVAAAFFCFNYVLYFFLSWLPSYLTDYQHLDVKSMSIIGMIPWLGAAVGFIGGGFISDLLLRKTGNGVLARKLVLSVGLGVSAVSVLLTTQVSSMEAAVALITLSSLFVFMCPQACWALLQELVPASRVGATGGFVHLLANLAGLMAPSVTGFLIQYAGGYSAAFALSAGLAALGMLVVVFLVRQPGSGRTMSGRVARA